MVAKRIKKYIDERGIKQTFIAQQTGMSDSVISDIFSRGRKIEVTEYYKICQALGVPFETFLKDEEEVAAV